MRFMAAALALGLSIMSVGSACAATTSYTFLPGERADLLVGKDSYSEFQAELIYDRSAIEVENITVALGIDVWEYMGDGFPDPWTVSTDHPFYYDISDLTKPSALWLEGNPIRFLDFRPTDTGFILNFLRPEVSCVSRQDRERCFEYNGSRMLLIAGRNISDSPATFTEILSSPAPLSAIPEPATWAMMVAGFVAAGAVLRGARRRTVPAAS